MKKFIKSFICILGVLVIITACNMMKTDANPEISIQFIVSDFTDEEFKYVGTEGLEAPTKDDFKSIEFNLDVKKLSKFSNRKITIPDIKNVANSYDRERYWYGGSYSQDNSQENFARYGYKFVFYSKGLDEQGIKNVFKAEEVKILWTKKNRNIEEKIFKLSDIIEFK